MQQSVHSDQVPPFGAVEELVPPGIRAAVFVCAATRAVISQQFVVDTIDPTPAVPEPVVAPDIAHNYNPRLVDGLGPGAS